MEVEIREERAEGDNAPSDAPADKQSGETFDGPPTLERSGSEHRRAVTSPVPWGERGLGKAVEPSLRVKRDGVIFEKPHSNDD